MYPIKLSCLFVMLFFCFFIHVHPVIWEALGRCSGHAGEVLGKSTMLADMLVTCLGQICDATIDGRNFASKNSFKR